MRYRLLQFTALSFSELLDQIEDGVNRLPDNEEVVSLSLTEGERHISHHATVLVRKEASALDKMSAQRARKNERLDDILRVSHND